MSRIARAGSTMVLVTIAFIVMGLAPVRTTTIRGRIIAWRQVDRVIQWASFAPNRELFLFQVESTKHSKRPTIFKIDYTHFGYTDITEAMLQQAALLTIRASREKSCDQSYGEFMSTAPVVREETSGSVMLSGISFVEKFKGPEIEPDRILKCYTLQKGDFEVVETLEH
jgi:hypothetical protein